MLYRYIFNFEIQTLLFYEAIRSSEHLNSKYKRLFGESLSDLALIQKNDCEKLIKEFFQLSKVS